MTYLVMECHLAYAIVLDQAGRIIKVANMGYEVGQKVDDVIEQQHRPALFRMRLASMVAAACLCLAVLGGGGYGACFIPYGTVHLKINPDVLMSVSYMDRVVGLEGLNEDGNRLIGQVSYKGKHAEEVTRLLVERAVDMGYLAEGGTVMVKADGGSIRWKQKREDDIGTGLRRQFEGRMQVEIKVGDDAGDMKDADGDDRTAAPDAPVVRPASRPASGHHPSMPARPAAAPAVPKAAEGMTGGAGRGGTGERDDDDEEEDDRDDDDEEEDDRDDGRGEEDDRDGGRGDGDDRDDGRGEEDDRDDGGRGDGDDRDGGRGDGDDRDDGGHGDGDDRDDGHGDGDDRDDGRGHGDDRDDGRGNADSQEDDRKDDSGHENDGDGAADDEDGNGGNENEEDDGDSNEDDD